MIKVVRGTIEHKHNVYVSREKNPEMMGSEFSVISLKMGETFQITTQEEYLFCLNQGTVKFRWDGCEAVAQRKSCFTHDPTILHVHTGTAVELEALSESVELNVANTRNEKLFENRLTSIFIPFSTDSRFLSAFLKVVQLFFSSSAIFRLIVDFTTSP